MFPKLYNSNETNFTHNGLGLLKDSIKAVAIEELNGMFELQIEYDSEGFLVDEIKEEMIIKAKANDKQDEQLFRIYSITKNHENDNLIIDAQHITYDLANNFVEKMEARNVTKKQVMEQIGASTAYPHPFNVTSSNSTTRSSTSLYRTNPLQMVAGMDGSILQIWGGQIERDNYNLILHDRRGSDDGVKILYKKNLTGLEAKFDISQLVTRIFPFVIKEATEDDPEQLITIPGKYIDSPFINNYEMPYILAVDFADKFENIEEVTPQQLYNVAQNWFTETGRDKPKVEMEVKFEHLWETEEYKHLAVLELVGMGDTVTVEHSKLNVEATAIVNRIEYDVIAEKNIAVDIGNVKARLTDSVNKVADVIEKVEHAEQTANQAIKAANGKNTNFYGADEPTSGMIEGDIWFQTIDGQYTRTWRYDGIQWQLVLSMDTKDAYDEAQQAKDDAQQAVDRANQATQQATNAINQAQTAFDSAQDAISTADGAFNRANDAFNNVTALSSLVDENTGEISTIKHSVQGLQVQTSDNAGNIATLTQTTQGLQSQVSDIEGNVATLQQTSQSLATRISDNEGNISTLTQTVQGLQTQVTDIDGNVTNLTQISTAMQARLTDAEGNINELTLTSQSLQSTISSVRDDLDGLEIGGRNLLKNSAIRLIRPNNSTTAPITNSIRDDELEKYVRTTPTNNTVLSTYEFIHEDLAQEITDGNVYVLSTVVRVPIDTEVRIALTFRDGTTVNPAIRRAHNVKAEHGWTKIFVVIEDVRPYDRINTTLHTDRVIQYVDHKNWKVEKGNKATDWSPAPEDMATQSQFTQLSNAINLRVQKGDVINQINISDESILIAGRRIHITGQTTIDNASIDGAAIKNASIGNAQIGSINAAKINSGELNTNLITIFGGSTQDYTSIQGSFIELRGRYNRTWQGTTTTHDVRTRLQRGHLRFRNDALNRSLYISEFGMSTYVDGEGELGGSSGTILWWDKTYSPSNSNGITMHSHGGVVALASNTSHVVLDSYQSARILSKNSGVIINPYDSVTQRHFWFSKTTDGLQGYLLFGDINRRGLRFSDSTDGILQVVDADLNTGGNTEIEAGYGRFNTVRRRSGTNYLYLQNPNYMMIGQDANGSARIASNVIYRRTYSSGANVHITGEDTLGRSTSARKYKTDIEPIAKEYAYNFFNNTHPVFYRPYNTDDERKDWSHYGYIADDVAPIEPRLVQYRDGELESFNYDRVPTLLHVVLKNEVKRIDALEKTINNADDRVSVLELKVQVLEQKIKLMEAS